MKKLLLASVCLFTTPALALPNPIGCYTWVATPEYVAKHPKEQMTMLRLSVKKATREDRLAWNWSIRLDATVRDSSEILSNPGGCDAGHSGDIVRCFLIPQNSPQGRSVGGFHLAPGRHPELFISNPVRMDENKLGLTDEDDRKIKLQKVDASICERDTAKALEGLRKVWGGEK